MRKYVVRRVLEIILTLYIYVTLVFFILQAMPGDVTQFLIENPQLDVEVREMLKHELGLDQPLHLQYLTYLKNFFRGQFGRSFSHYPRPVWDIIKERLPRTALLFVTATILSFYLGFFLGKLIAWRRGQLIEYTSTVTGVMLWTVFTPMFALLLIWGFAVILNIFPINNFLEPEKWLKVNMEANTVFLYLIATIGGLFLLTLSSFLLSRRLSDKRARLLAFLVPTTVGAVATLLAWKLSGQCWGALAKYGGQVCLPDLALDIIWHMGLPVMTLTLIAFGGTMLLMRSSMLETIREDYVMAAKAKGLPDKVVRDKHAARNAMLPVITSFVLSLALSIDGGIITETLFSWPGMGLTLLNSVLENDYPLAIGALVFVGILALIAHLVADILYAYLDPRIRYD